MGLVPYHLPGWESRPDGESIRLPLPGTGFELPQLDAAEVAAVWRFLETAAAAWRERDLGTRAGRIAAVAAALRERGAGAWSLALERSTRLSGAGLTSAWDATFAPCEESGLSRLLNAEGLSHRAHDGRGWPRRVVHVLPGNVLPPTFAMLVRGWLLGAAQWLRPASGEPLFAAALAAQLNELAPELAATFAISWWPHRSAMESAVLGSADLVTVQGDDASVAAVESRTAAVAPQARVCGYGDRWSIALLSRAAQTPANAAGVALDLALFDGHGCLSPRWVMVEKGPKNDAWCRALARSLAEQEELRPRGPRSDVERAGLRSWRESMRLGVVLGSVRGYWESPGGTAWACALLAPGHRPAEAPADRHVPVVPFASAADCLALLGPDLARLQGVAADLRGWEPERCNNLVGALGPSRLAAPGSLQQATPEWRQDHRPPLGAWFHPGA